MAPADDVAEDLFLRGLHVSVGHLLERSHRLAQRKDGHAAGQARGSRGEDVALREGGDYSVDGVQFDHVLVRLVFRCWSAALSL